jgi:hypothetical protein
MHCACTPETALAATYVTVIGGSWRWQNGMFYKYLILINKIYNSQKVAAVKSDICMPFRAIDFVAEPRRIRFS